MLIIFHLCLGFDGEDPYVFRRWLVGFNSIKEVPK